MTTKLAVLIVACLTPLLAQLPVADEALYERGLQLIEAGRYETARLSLQTLLNTYPDSTFRQCSRTAIRESWVRQGIPDVDAFLLYREGALRLAEGRRRAARLAFQTLINQYPDSAHVAMAREGIEESRKAEHHGH